MQVLCETCFTSASTSLRPDCLGTSYSDWTEKSKSIYNIGNEKKYRVIFATLADFMTLCSKIKARGHKCI